MEEERRPRKKYTTEFKIEAVARSKKVGSTKACEELGISSSTIHHWKKEYSGETKKISADIATYDELKTENRKLKKELGYVEEINRVLKKSTAIFSSKELGGFK